MQSPSLSDQAPEVIVIGGPNGAGKTTTAARILPYGLDVNQFVNADYIAKGIAPHDPDSAAIPAGREMLARLKRFKEAGENFSFESTLASKGFATFLGKAKADGFVIRLGYKSLDSPELAVNRVRQRVTQGGHAIPEDVIRRRYWRSLANFERLYAPQECKRMTPSPGSRSSNEPEKPSPRFRRREWSAEEEQEIQLRMYREALRATQDRVRWLEEHNFPIWICHEGEVIDARTLPPEERDPGPDPDSITELEVVETIYINGPGVLDREGWVPPQQNGSESV